MSNLTYNRANNVIGRKDVILNVIHNHKTTVILNIIIILIIFIAYKTLLGIAIQNIK
jgi:ribosomal protein S24E